MIRTLLAGLLLLIASVSLYAFQDPKIETPADGIPRISIEEVKAKLDAKNGNVVVVDVRGFITTKIKGALHIPFAELEAHLKDLPKNKFIVTTCSCSSEATSGAAAKLLMSKGYKVAALKGGQRAWESANYPIEQVAAESNPK